MPEQTPEELAAEIEAIKRECGITTPRCEVCGAEMKTRRRRTCSVKCRVQLHRRNRSPDHVPVPRKRRLQPRVEEWER